MTGRLRMLSDTPAMRVLNGEKLAKVARECGVSRFVLSERVRCCLEAQPGYVLDDFLEVLKEPGQGRVRASITYYRMLGGGS